MEKSKNYSRKLNLLDSPIEHNDDSIKCKSRNIPTFILKTYEIL